VLRFSHPVDSSMDWNIFCEELFKFQDRRIGRDIVPPLFPVFLLLRADREGRQGRSSCPRVSISTKSVVSSNYSRCKCASSSDYNRASHLQKVSKPFNGLNGRWGALAVSNLFKGQSVGRQQCTPLSVGLGNGC
jgi:hypothetical protein